MAKRYKDDLSAAIHEIAEELHRYGVIDEETMHEFDNSCLCPAAKRSVQKIRYKRKASSKNKYLA